MRKPVQIATLGDASILDLSKVGLLSSRKVPSAVVTKCYDRTTEMRDKGVCVMGGFRSPLERDVLTLLLQGKQPVIWVLAHKLWTEKSIPKLYLSPLPPGVCWLSRLSPSPWHTILAAPCAEGFGVAEWTGLWAGPPLSDHQAGRATRFLSEVQCWNRTEADSQMKTPCHISPPRCGGLRV